VPKDRAEARGGSGLGTAVRTVGRICSWELKRWSYVDRGGGVEDTVLVAGSGRSGTTWIEELVNRNRDYRVLFEPFWSRHVPELRPFGDYRYVPPSQADPEFAAVVEPILTGRVRNRWIDHHNTVHVAHRRLAKEIRANNWVGWAADRWPQMTVVFVVRHPMAVVSSGGSLGWGDGLDRVLSQPALLTDHFDEDTQDYLRSLKDPWERSVARWCAENVVPFRTLGPSRATLVVYEALVSRDEEEVSRLLRAVNQEPDATLTTALDKPSRLARAGGPLSPDPAAGGWLDRLDPAVRRRGVDVITRLGFGAIYGDSSEPDVRAARRLWDQADRRQDS
jgi:hypothetical protein